MNESSELASEIRTYTYQADEFPSWQEAKGKLLESGKSLEFINRLVK